MQKTYHINDVSDTEHHIDSLIMKDSETFLEISYSKNMNNFTSLFSTVEDYYDQKDKCYSNNSDIYDDTVIQCYVCDAEFLSNNKLHSHLKKCLSFNQKTFLISMNSLQELKIIELNVIKSIISDNYSFQQ